MKENVKRLRRPSGEAKYQRMTVSKSEPYCHIHFSNGKRMNVTLAEGKLVQDLLRDVSTFSDVDHQVSYAGP